MSRIRKISRQVSVLVLALISIGALLLATGIVAYTGFESEGEQPPIITPGDDSVTIIDDEPPPLVPPGTEDSLPVLATSIIVVCAFVLIWFLVFRPRAGSEIDTPDGQDPPIGV